MESSGRELPQKCNVQLWYPFDEGAPRETITPLCETKAHTSSVYCSVLMRSLQSRGGRQNEAHFSTITMVTRSVTLYLSLLSVLLRMSLKGCAKHCSFFASKRLRCKTIQPLLLPCVKGLVSCLGTTSFSLGWVSCTWVSCTWLSCT